MAGEPLRLVLVEDDDADAFLVTELLDEAHLNVTVVQAHTLAEALTSLRQTTAVGPEVPQCVLLDLALPDAAGLEALHAVLKTAPQTAVIVLTGHVDEHRGIEAVAAGAQDYLVKGDVDGRLLVRAIRFALERKRSEESTRRLQEAEHFARENARLERGLLPLPLVGETGLTCLTRYRPGRRRALLGGDFYDVIELDDGQIFALVGDVSGHGPDSAALGVYLRIAWRTLVLAGTDPAVVLPTLNEIVARERRITSMFATVCMTAVAKDRCSARIFLAGHPAPIWIRLPQAPAEAKQQPTQQPTPAVTQLPEEPHGPMLGLMASAHWPDIHVDLGDEWLLLLYTDGLFEGKVSESQDRLGEDGLVQLIADQPPAIPPSPHWPGDLINAAEHLNGDGLPDDVALVALTQQQLETQQRPGLGAHEPN